MLRCRNPIHSLLVPAVLLCFAACQGGLGSVPEGLIELYDLASPDGLIELEIDRGGAIREMEADIPVDRLPELVTAAAFERAPGAQISGAERELTSRGAAWEVKLRHQGRDWEFVIDDKGNVLETEKELRREEAPAAVLEAAEQAIAGGSFKSVEVITAGEMTEYHVKKLRDGASYKVVLTPDGHVKRAVREARAEIEIPLK